jgi:hypothetical protein
MADSITDNGSSVSFVGPRAVNVYACAAVASALRVYANSGIKMNRAYTPTNMLAFVLQQTGTKFPKTKAGYYNAAAKLMELVASERAAIEAANGPVQSVA